MKVLIFAILLASPVLGGNQPFIIGGENVTAGEYPYLVSISTRYLFLCGGTLIDKSVIATVASCLYNSEGNLYDLRTISVTAGDHLLYEFDEGEQTRGVQSIVQHPQFFIYRDEEEGPYILNDMALLVTSTPFNLSDTVKLAKLPNETLTLTEGTAVGWGWKNETHFAGHLPPQKVQLETADNMTCAGKYSKNGFNPSLQFCAGGENKGICMNDYGGPFLVGSDNVFAGILSSVFPANATCGKDTTGSPVIRVAPYVDWILETIGDGDEGVSTEPTTSTSTTENATPSQSTPSTTSSTTPGSGPTTTPIESTTAGGTIFNSQYNIIFIAVIWLVVR